GVVEAAIDRAHEVPLAWSRVDFNHGNEQLRRVCAAWAERHGIQVSQLRPIVPDDVNSHSRSHHMVHRYGFRLPYRTEAECSLLNRLWRLVNDRLNFLTPTKKPVGWENSGTGRKERVYDVPATPVYRLLTADVFSPAQEAELREYRRELNPARMSREISEIQAVLMANTASAPEFVSV